MRLRFPTFFLQDFEYARDGFADVIPELIHGFALRVAAWQRRNLAPKSAIRIFMDDNRVFLHASIFP